MEDSDKVIRWTPLLCAVLAVIGLGSMQARADIVNMKIFFEEACPKGVSDPDLLVDKKNKTQINWMAYNMDGTEPVEQDFAIFFDPFKNSELTSNKGELMSPKLGETQAPSATYKYTIVGDNCPEAPHDPHIRLR
jgi:hypothetical protein